MITFYALSALATLAAPQAEAVSLGRVFTKGEKMAYSVSSGLSAERRTYPLKSAFPEDFDLRYNFTMEVQSLKADGIAQIRYQRPTMTFIDGETFDAPPKTKVEKSNYDLQILLSPVNEIIDIKDIAKKPAPKKPGAKNKSLIASGAPTQDELGPILGQFVSEIYRLSLFAGNLDTSLDLNPKMSFNKVKVGDTWKKTASYQPQKLKGAKKSIVQRLDYTYTYRGILESNGKKVYRIDAALDLDTDLNEFINDTYEVTSKDTGLKKLPLNLKARVAFDLDLKTRHTLLATAQTEGGYQVFVEDHPNEPIQEMKLKGQSTMRLVSRTLPVLKKK